MEDPFNQFHCSIAPRPPAAVSEDGSYKIDADPDAFSVILTWLRRRRLLLKTDTILESVLVEAEYFGLEELKEEVEGLISVKKTKDYKEAEEREEKKVRDENMMVELRGPEGMMAELRSISRSMHDRSGGGSRRGLVENMVEALDGIRSELVAIRRSIPQ